jgi:ATP-binding cassette subfamily B protein IrtA
MKNIETQKPKRKTGFRRLIEIAGTKKWWLFASMALAVIATVVQFIPVVTVYMIIVELAEHATDISQLNSELLYNLGFTSLISFASWGILLYTSSMLSHIAAFNILYEMRVKIAKKLTKLSMGFFTQKASGKIKKVMSEDVEKVELFVAHHIPDITSAIVFPIIMMIYLFFVDWRLALAAIIPIPFAYAVQMRMMSSMDTYREYHNSLETMNAAVVEYVRGMPVVKVFNASSDSFMRLKTAISSYRKFIIKLTNEYAQIYPAFLTVISSSLVFIIPVAVFLLSGMNVYEQFMPTVFLFLIVGGGMFFPFLKLMFVSGYLREISVGVERVDEILYTPEITETDVECQPNDFSVEFDDVSFGYTDSNVLSNVSFTAKPKTVTALVGPSGAGKTTIGFLTARFWDVNSGTIRIGDVDIKDVRTETLMNYVSFVFQDGFLFFDTIEENIRMGNQTASKEDVIAAAKASQCHEFIMNLPHGYNTLIGEGGTYLSGGEQQRISIARAILKNAPIVVLDEATAYADPENEGKIVEALAHLIKNKTVIVIAHRLSTVVDADQILVIDNGQIVQTGRHDDLVAVDGLYKTMWDTYSRSREWTIEKTGRAVA